MTTLGVSSTNPGPNVSAQPAQIAPLSVTADSVGAPTGALVANNQNIGITGAQLAALGANGVPVYTGTWAGRTSAVAAGAGALAYISDVPSSLGAYFRSNGVSWLPPSPIILAQSSVPVGIAPTFTGTTNGAFTLGTALAATYGPTASNCPGIWLYFAANTLNAAQPAGLYWCVMTSTTAGTAFNNTLSGYASSASIPASPVAFSGAVPGGAGATAEITLATASLPGGLLGPNGVMWAYLRWEVPSNANVKNVCWRLGSTLVMSRSITGMAVEEQALSFGNRGVQNAQVSDRANTVGTPSQTSSGTLDVSAIDTSVTQMANLSMQLATATDFAVLGGFSFVVYPG